MSDVIPGDTEALDNVVSRYKSEGFDVFIQPSGTILPSFFRGIRPDAIAIDPERKIAIEVVRSNTQSSAKLNRLNEIIREHPNWELHVVYVSSLTPARQIQKATTSAVEATVQQISALRDTGQRAAALVIGWSALEAIARILLPDRLARPQPAERLLEVLASEAYVTPSEADLLRPVAVARNAAAHGQLEAQIESSQLDALISTLHTLIALAPKSA